MSSNTALKDVFMLLEGTDLAACMVVCKQWGKIAEDDYLWKCLCAKKWPSCKNYSASISYRKLFEVLCIKEKSMKPTSLTPKISLSDVEFCITIWGDESLIFSEIAPAPALCEGSLTPPKGIVSGLEDHLEGPEYKLILSLKQGFVISSTQEVYVSVSLARKDTNKVACIANQMLDCSSGVDWSEGRAIAYVQVAEFPLSCQFVNFASSAINNEISLLFIKHGEDDLNVFAFEMNFLTAYSEDNVLWALAMLDWR